MIPADEQATMDLERLAAVRAHPRFGEMLASFEAGIAHDEVLELLLELLRGRVAAALPPGA